jgi:uncharacterized protein (DUF849 family)
VLIKACLNGGRTRDEHPSVLRAAIRLGRDIRVGLEDTTVLADGRVASGNGELVEAAVRLAAELSDSS